MQQWRGSRRSRRDAATAATATAATPAAATPAAATPADVAAATAVAAVAAAVATAAATTCGVLLFTHWLAHAFDMKIRGTLITLFNHILSDPNHEWNEMLVGIC